ncbi:MAG TPA: RNA methyltransferase [Isosphaeraceae bacterium]|nr:RNA methyltransferase [Isosphaeraceae bacterium]
MRFVEIRDLDDPRLAVYRHLKTSNETRGDRRFVVEGEKLVERLVESRFPVESVLVSARNADRVAEKVSGTVPVYVVEDALIDLVVGFNFHQGVLGCGIRQAWPSAREILRSRGARGTLIVAPRLDNPENLGTLVRLADVFGVDAILTGRRCPDALSRRVLRVSMGMSLRVPVLAMEDLPAEVESLRRDEGLGLAATVTDPEAEPFDQFVRPQRLGLVLGSESAGLEPDWVRRCDRKLTIPMRPGAESLNVAVAAGVLLYQVMKGEW